MAYHFYPFAQADGAAYYSPPCKSYKTQRFVTNHRPLSWAGLVTHATRVAICDFVTAPVGPMNGARLFLADNQCVIASSGKLNK